MTSTSTRGGGRSHDNVTAKNTTPNVLSINAPLCRTQVSNTDSNTDDFLLPGNVADWINSENNLKSDARRQSERDDQLSDLPAGQPISAQVSTNSKVYNSEDDAAVSDAVLEALIFEQQLTNSEPTIANGLSPKTDAAPTQPPPPSAYQRSTSMFEGPCRQAMNVTVASIGGGPTSMCNVASSSANRHAHFGRLGHRDSNLSVDPGDRKDSANSSRENSSYALWPPRAPRDPKFHKESFTEDDYHNAKRSEYKKSRRRHFTDPVDFEGILNIIGGCSWWQIWVYVLISLQQIPHAMFNLSVTYMMFQPDHWCDVKGVVLNMPSDHAGEGHGMNWTWNQVLNVSSNYAFPNEENHQRSEMWHSHCTYYDRGEAFYHNMSHLPFSVALEHTKRMDKANPPDVKKCSSWIYDDGVMSETMVTEWDLVCDDNVKRAHAHLVYALGFLVGCALSGFTSDRFGRKPTVIGFGVLSSLFGLVLPYSTYFPMFLLLRFCGAVCNEAADLAAYVLCMEITGTKYRAMVGSLVQAPWALGYCFLALVAYVTRSWRTMQLVTAALHTGAVLLICVLPESPRWLIVNNRVRESETIIRRACRMNGSTLPDGLELVKHAEQRKWVKRNERANLLHLVKSPELMTRTALIFVIWVSTALVYYGLIMDLSDQSAPGRALFSGNFFVNNAIAGAVELPTLVACVFLMRLGRKRSQMITLIGAGMCTMIACVAMAQKSSTIALVMTLLGKVCIQGGFNILYIFTSELYPTVIRNSAVGICSMVARLGSGASSYIIILSDLTSNMLPMTIFSVISLIGGFAVLFLPETRDQPLPDTLQDAVTFLKSDRGNQCGIGFIKRTGQRSTSSNCTDGGSAPPARIRHSAGSGTSNAAGPDNQGGSGATPNNTSNHVKAPLLLVDDVEIGSSSEATAKTETTTATVSSELGDTVSRLDSPLPSAAPVVRSDTSMTMLSSAD